MTDDEDASHARVLAEYRVLEEVCLGQDDFPEEIDARLGELEVAMEALEARPMIFDPAEVARAAVFVTLDRECRLAPYRGYVRPVDEPQEEAAVDSDDDLVTRQGQEGDGGISDAQSGGGVHVAAIITSGVSLSGLICRMMRLMWR